MSSPSRNRIRLARHTTMAIVPAHARRSRPAAAAGTRRARGAGFDPTGAGLDSTVAGFGATDAGFAATGVGLTATDAGFAATGVGFAATGV